MNHVEVRYDRRRIHRKLREHMSARGQMDDCDDESYVSSSCRDEEDDSSAFPDGEFDDNPDALSGLPRKGQLNRGGEIEDLYGMNDPERRAAGGSGSGGGGRKKSEGFDSMEKALQAHMFTPRGATTTAVDPTDVQGSNDRKKKKKDSVFRRLGRYGADYDSVSKEKRRRRIMSSLHVSLALFLVLAFAYYVVTLKLGGYESKWPEGGSGSEGRRPGSYGSYGAEGDNLETKQGKMATGGGGGDQELTEGEFFDAYFQSLAAHIDGVTDGAVTNSQALHDPFSPQYKSLRFLTTERHPMPYDPVQSMKLAQRYALGVVYYATEGLHWKKKFDFMTPNLDECFWNEVDDKNNVFRGAGRCDGDGLVTAVALYENDLRGPVPSELGILTQVSVLSLSNNGLQGRVPESFLQLTNLETLYLHGNPGITGNLNFLCDSNIPNVRSDCKGPNPTVTCDCCRACY